MGIIECLQKEKELVWINPKYEQTSDYESGLTMEDVEDAEKRLQRFAPFLEKAFPEVRKTHGIIESPLREIQQMAEEIAVSGRLFLKMDSHLPIAGSVKARGGIYEVLKYREFGT